MTRSSLTPINAHNPDVETQRPGYCVFDEGRQVFACDPADGTTGEQTMVYGLHVGWCGPRGMVRVWASLGAASAAAMSLHASVTTVPRCNGVVREWAVLS